MAGARGKPGPGRPKGSINKINADLKAAILNAFTTVGGEGYLVKVARDDPKTFCALLGKVLPMQVNADVSGGFTINVVKRDA